MNTTSVSFDVSCHYTNIPHNFLLDGQAGHQIDQRFQFRLYGLQLVLGNKNFCYDDKYY